jgi:hypothetical protein
VVTKRTIFWDITSCSPLKVNRSFGVIYRLHLQGLTSGAKYQRESRWQAELHGAMSQNMVQCFYATMSTFVSLVFLRLQASTKRVAKLLVATAAFPTSLHQIKPFSLGATELFFRIIKREINYKIKILGSLCKYFTKLGDLGFI